MKTRKATREMTDAEIKAEAEHTSEDDELEEIEESEDESPDEDNDEDDGGCRIPGALVTGIEGRTVKAMESEEAREMRESIEEMERELAELDRDIAEARKGDKGDMSAVALENFLQMRRDVVEVIESNKELYKTVLQSEELERRLERGKK